MRTPDKKQTANPNEEQSDIPLTESRCVRLHAVRALEGSLAHVPFSSDDFARLKQEEIEREERKFARLFPDAR
jgi:hypothetical protein